MPSIRGESSVLVFLVQLLTVQQSRPQPARRQVVTETPPGGFDSLLRHQLDPVFTQSESPCGVPGERAVASDSATSFMLLR